MLTTQNLPYNSIAENNGSEVPEELYEVQTGALSINGTGRLVITNTGGSSASEGGMGSGSDDDTEKGSLSKPGEKSGSASKNDEDEDLTFDPIKKNVKEAEKARNKE